MGKYDGGILGSFLGKVGAVIGGSWRGIRYMRQKGPSKRANNSKLQIEQQAKFKLAVDFVMNMTRIIEITQKNAPGMTPRNSALRNILKDAITGEYPTYEIDYSKIVLSKGRLPVGENATATEAGGILTYRWRPGDVEDVNPRDHSIIMLYCPSTGQSRYRINLAPRSAGVATFDVTAFAGKVIHTYLCFRSEDGEKISNSVYTGEVQVS